MGVDNVQRVPDAFAPWIKYFPGRDGQACRGATVVFPHAGAAAASYRRLALALAAGGDTFVVQYPQRAERIDEPPAKSVHELARDLFEAGPWQHVSPLRLFGHSMGAVVAFEFARVAEERDVFVQKLWVSSGPVPSAVAGLPELPTSGPEVLADLTDLGGTDPRLLADEEFAELVTTAARSDYEVLNRYHCPAGVRIRADIHAVAGRHDHRVDIRSLREWATHTEGAFTLSFFDGGHFYVNQHIHTLANRVITDV
jgi:surfactin synthase thioesterase subunit